MKKINYSIGLDIGTNSVGWACVDEKFNVLKYRGRNAIGVYEFDAGETAAERRVKRGTRRRYSRRKRRIQLLQELWTSVMDRPKPFFSYVDEVSSWRKDNQFEEKSLTHVLKSININPKKYPTIYHLRAALMKENRKFNIELIYLAIHNLVKHRGHFINGTHEWLEGSRGGNELESLDILIKQYQQLINDSTQIGLETVSSMLHIFNNNEWSKTEKHQKIMTIAPVTISEFIKLLLNLTTTYVKLFTQSPLLEEYKELKSDAAKLQISAEDFETKLDILLEDEREFMFSSVLVYQQIQLKELLGEHDYVAVAKVDSFNTFQQELTQLKEIIRNYGTEEEYRKMFITSKENWRTYKTKPDINLLCVLDRYSLQAKPNTKMNDMIGNSVEKQNNKNTELYFNLFVRQLIHTYIPFAKTQDQLEQLEIIIKKIDERKYMVKQVNKNNSAIPVQNSMFEVRKILQGQAKYYPAMTTEWIESVIQIIRFRIPYYVGPLVKEQTNSKFGWLVRDVENTRITPWNFESIINQSKTAEGFITRMTSKCTYLRSEDVLPKHSLLYQQFELLDELNRIQIRRPSEEKHIDFRLDPKLKKWLVEELFQKKLKVSHTDMLQAILRSPYKESYADYENGERYQIYGTSKEKEFASTQSSYLKLKSIFGQLNEDANEFYEEIIYTLTVFNEDQIIRHRLEHLKETNNFGYLIHEDVIRQLLAWKLTGWGRLSKHLLQGIPVYKNNHLTLIEVMLKQHFVFNELMSPKHSYSFVQKQEKQVSCFQKRIELYNREQNKHNKKTYRLTYTDIKDLVGSPAIKRGIWKAVKLVEELVTIFGDPQHIMIEVAREEGKKKVRTLSREQQWKKIGQNLKNSEYANFYENHSNFQSNSQFMQTKFWLYLLQGGKSLYSQKPLKIENLSNYEIDHIIPRKVVKDDSINNLALVFSGENQRKEGDFVPLQIIDEADHYKMKSYWKDLLELNMISRKKYESLMRRSLNETEINGFIQRQLVETRQIIKHIQELFQDRFKETTTHLVKSNLISNFRLANRLPKVREINNKHHAVDAFLMVALIQSIIKKYGVNFFQFSLQRKDLDQALAQRASGSEEFFIFRNFHDSQYPKLLDSEGMQSGMEYLEEMMYKLPWQSTYAVGSSEASFYNETIYSPKEKKGYDKLKDTLSYSELTHDGFNNIFSFIIQADEIKKKETVKKRYIIDVRLFDYYQMKKLNDQELVEKLVEKYYSHFTNPVCITRLNKYQRVIYNGEPAYFISSTELRNAKHLELDKVLHLDIAELLIPKFSRKKGDQSDKEVIDYKKVFSVLGKLITDKYNHLPGVNLEKFNKISQSLDNQEEAVKMIGEALKVSAANALRSDTLGGRWSYTNGIKAELLTVIHESSTGLKFRN